MTTEAVSTEIINKIAAILAKADPSKNPNPQEVEVAAAFAARFLQQYNLTEAEVRAATGEKEEKVVIIEDAFHIPDDDEDVSVEHQWFQILLNAVSRSCFVKPLISPKARLAIFVGREREVHAAKIMFSTLFALMMTKQEQALKKVQEDFRATPEYHISHLNYFEYLARRAGSGKNKQKRDYRKSWLSGCAIGIGAMLNRETSEFQKGGTGSALVVYRQQEIDNYLSGQKIGEGKIRRNDVNQHAREEGYREGLNLGQAYGSKKLDDGK